eukprot:5374014-Pyramimonas_sp.AAC.1
MATFHACQAIPCVGHAESMHNLSESDSIRTSRCYLVLQVYATLFAPTTQANQPKGGIILISEINQIFSNLDHHLHLIAIGTNTATH